MSINIGSTLGFLICSWLGEKIGWHWGFGAAGVGMFFGVLQYINFKHLLGEAGNKPNDMPQAQRDSYIKWSKITAGLMVIVIALGLLGIITVEPKVFAENFALFLTAVAAVYFAYLFLGAGLTATEKKECLFAINSIYWSSSLLVRLRSVSKFIKYLCSRLHRSIRWRLHYPNWLVAVC